MTSEYSPKIFIVDDSEVQLVLLEKVLLNDGYHVNGFLRGNRLYTALLNERPDLIISDIDMPVLNGFELVQKIKSSLDTKNVPCLLISSQGNSSIYEKVQTIGADGFIKKPFEYYALKTTISNLLGNYSVTNLTD